VTASDARRVAGEAPLNPLLLGGGEYPFLRLARMREALLPAGVRPIDFSIGDPREETPEFIREALRAAVPAVSSYPAVAGLPELRVACAPGSGTASASASIRTQILPANGTKGGVPAGFRRHRARPRATRDPGPPTRSTGGRASPGRRRTRAARGATAFASIPTRSRTTCRTAFVAQLPAQSDRRSARPTATRASTSARASSLLGGVGRGLRRDLFRRAAASMLESGVDHVLAPTP
jgi:hypothetical protein